MHAAAWVTAVRCRASSQQPETREERQSKRRATHQRRHAASQAQRAVKRAQRDAREEWLAQQQQLKQEQLDSPAAAAAEPGLCLDCPHFTECSGCTLDTGLDRPPLLATAQRFFEEKLGYEGFGLNVGSPHAWRQRARLAVRQGADGRPVVGLFNNGTHEVTPIPSCVVHHPAINVAVQLVQQAVEACGIEAYEEDGGTGDLRYIQATVVQPGGGNDSSEPQVQLALVWNAAADDAEAGARLAALGAKLWAVPGGGGGGRLLHSVWGNFQPARNNVILGADWRLLHGAEWAWAALGGASICFGPGSFMQANPGQMDACLAAMQRWVPEGSTVADLHAGVGTIALSLAATRSPRWVRCVEINGQGQAPFQLAADRLRAQLAVAGGGGGVNVQGLARDYQVAAAGSDPGRWCKDAETVICDPPRKGLEPPLLKWLAGPAPHASGVRRLLYLSCGFPALQRDLRALLAGGRWRLAHAESYLFFPGSDHLETLVVLETSEPAV